MASKPRRPRARQGASRVAVRAAGASIALASIGLPGCGGGGVNEARPSRVTDEETTAADDLSLPYAAAPTATPGHYPEQAEALSSLFIGLGFTEAEATCLASELGIEDLQAGEMPDLSALPAHLDACGIDQERLTELAPTTEPTASP